MAIMSLFNVNPTVFVGAIHHHVQFRVGLWDTVTLAGQQVYCYNPVCS